MVAASLHNSTYDYDAVLTQVSHPVITATREDGFNLDKRTWELKQRQAEFQSFLYKLLCSSGCAAALKKVMVFLNNDDLLTFLEVFMVGSRRE